MKEESDRRGGDGESFGVEKNARDSVYDHAATVAATLFAYVRRTAH
jgi:hypothetical protein